MILGALGIDRRISYANKKYHSGLIWLLNINEDLFWLFGVLSRVAPGLVVGADVPGSVT